MSDYTTLHVQPAGTSVACYVAEAEPLRPRVDVRHDPSYVTQLMANAADLPNMPQRRKTDRAGPLAAYGQTGAFVGRTRRIA